MDPVEWGPQFWHTIHAVALEYPARPTPDDRRRYWEWYKATGWVLPCAGCAHKYRDLFMMGPVRLAPADLAGPDALFAWTVRLHNAVNMSLGKPQCPLEAARARFEGL